MAEERPARILGLRAAYVGLCLLIIFLHLLPLETMPRRWAAPDYMMALTLAWVVRRPDLVPVLSIALVMLLADLMFHRPPGLWAALTVLGCEYLRRRSRSLRDSGFVSEWLTVAAVLLVLTFADRLVLAMTLTPAPSLGLNLIQAFMTIAFYPVVVVLSHLLFGLRPATPGEIDARGRAR